MSAAASTGGIRYPPPLNNIPLLDISRGLYPGMELERKFGANDAVGTSFEVIWQASTSFVWPTTAETVRIAAGGSATDNPGGNGAHTVRVIGLDENWEVAEEDITTNGASASSATTTTFRRILRAYVTESTLYANPYNAGDITIENTTSTQTLALIGSQLGQTQLSQYTVKAGYTAYLGLMAVESEANKPAEIRMFQRQNADDSTSPVTARRLVTRILGLEGEYVEDGEWIVAFPEKTDLWLEAKVDSGSGSVNCAYHLLLVQD